MGSDGESPAVSQSTSAGSGRTATRIWTDGLRVSCLHISSGRNQDVRRLD